MFGLITFNDTAHSTYTKLYLGPLECHLAPSRNIYRPSIGIVHYLDIYLKYHLKRGKKGYKFCPPLVGSTSLLCLSNIIQKFLLPTACSVRLKHMLKLAGHHRQKARKKKT